MFRISKCTAILILCASENIYVKFEGDGEQVMQLWSYDLRAYVSAGFSETDGEQLEIAVPLKLRADCIDFNPGYLCIPVI